nr:tetratricopeptide repeat protein [Micromonospora purpureochromogenes]
MVFNERPTMALDELTRRLGEYRTRRDPRLIMADDVPALMDAIMVEVSRRSSAQSYPDPVAVRCVATMAAVIWYTAEHSAPQQGRSMRRNAVGLAAMLQPPYPDVLPADLARLCADHHRGPLRWNHQAVSLLSIPAQSDAARVDEAIALLDRSVSGTPDIHPAHIDYLANLAHAQRMRFDLSGERADLDTAITTRRRAVAAVDPGPEQATHLCDLGLALRQRFLAFDDRMALDEAVDMLGRAIEAAATDDLDRWRYLNNLANALRDQYQATQDAEALDRSIDAARRAVRCIPRDEPFRAACLANLALALHDRFDRNHSPEDLVEAVTAYRSAVRTADDHTQASPWRARLAALTMSAGIHRGEGPRWATAMAAVDAAAPDLPDPRQPDSGVPGQWNSGAAAVTIDVARARWLAAHPARRSVPAGTTRALFSLLVRTVDRALQHDVRDIDSPETKETISDLLDRWAQLAGDERSASVTVIAWAAWLRYLALPLGHADDERELALVLFAAVAESDQADALPASVLEVLHVRTSSPHRATPDTHLAALAKKIAFTLQRARSPQDLTLVTDAIELAQRFLTAADDHPDRGQTLANLAGAHAFRAQIRADEGDQHEAVAADLDLAVDAARAALRLGGRPHDLDTARTNLASVLQSRIDQVGTDTGCRLDDAIAFLLQLRADPLVNRIPIRRGPRAGH